ncbi:MAG: BamA/TamA family outer membrane protein [Candidatus Zixiibacteriota bacterium]
MSIILQFARPLFIILLAALCYVPLFAASVENIKEADSLEQKRSGFVLLPILYYTPETKLAGGGLLNYYFRESHSKTSTRPSSVMPSLIYTQNKQIMAELSTYLYWKDEAYYSQGYIGYVKFPDKFYGIGNNTPEDDEEDYTRRFTRMHISFQKRVLPGFYLGIQYELIHSKLIGVEKGGLLEKGDIFGSDCGIVSGGTFLASWDTRNNVYYPFSGCFHQFSASFFKSALGSDYDFNRYTLDLRQYFPFFSSHVLALQGYLSSTTGDPPFQMLCLLGGQNMMRGYYQGRYRDKNIVVFQAEYRIPFWRRLGLAGFSGFGDVADRFSNFRLSDFKYSLGAGIRYTLSQQESINLRFDIGFGEGSSGVYVTLNEAF